jgi:cytochrome P450
VVRITPHEVSFNDPQNHDKIHHVGSRFSKDPIFYCAFMAPASSLTTSSNSLHRIRRSATSPLFSRKAVLDLQSVVLSKVEKLCARLDEALAQDQPFDFYQASRALSVDVATDYAFDDCYNLLSKDNYGADLMSMVSTSIRSMWFLMQFPLLIGIITNLQDHITGLSPLLAMFAKYKAVRPLPPSFWPRGRQD